MRDVMLDLETFGTANDAAIVTIGACIFDADTGEIPDRDDGDRCFHAAIHLDSMTGSLDPGTVLWWLKQEQARRLLLERIETGAYEEMQALNLFSAWLQHRLPSPANYDTRVRLWSNGPTFDEVILRAAYKRYGLRFPIHSPGIVTGKRFPVTIQGGESW